MRELRVVIGAALGVTAIGFAMRWIMLALGYDAVTTEAIWQTVFGAVIGVRFCQLFDRGR